VFEFELKFHVDASHRSAVEAAVDRGQSGHIHLQARYFDTPDGALAARQVVLRLRKEGPRWVQTAKAPAGGLLLRHEHNVDLSAAEVGDPPLPLVERHAGTPVGALLADALRAAEHPAGTRDLVPFYDTDIRRATRDMRTGDARVELAFDRGAIRAGERSLALQELEIELKSGSARSMLELARRWVPRYALWLDTRSKAERGERLAHGLVHGLPVKARPPMLARRSDGPALVRAVLTSCLAQILPNASEVCAGSGDPEHVHQLRVGIRRLRTALREMADFGVAFDPAWEPVLADTFRALGQQRDHDHLRLTVQPQVEAAGGPHVEWPEIPAAGLEPPGAIACAARFQIVLLDVLAASLPSELKQPPEDEPLHPRNVLSERLARLHRQVVRDGTRFETLPPIEQHRVRKRLKRLRYLGEAVATLFDPQRAARYLEMLEPAQDALGRHNDAAVASAACRRAAEQEPRAWFAVGWLEARQPASAIACRDALAGLARAQPFWKRAKR